ncbi:multidrug effflux MFS transporter [Acetobacteraceae bacterium H6797]|nr:multidrug effflux MFS transporter [Acetobacteraceae bacterium H6797]
MSEAPKQSVMTAGRTAFIGALIIALGPMSLSLYGPAMPTLAEYFQTTPAVLNLTITVYFLGYAFAQLLCGPLSDGYGRRPVALGFFALYTAGSVVALFATDITVLMIGRAMQGIGVAAGAAISRAFVRDQFQGASAARIMNLMGTMLAIGPALAPTIGGLILGLFGWHWIFLVMVVYGVVVLAVLGFATAETNPRADPALVQPVRIVANYGRLLREPEFMRPALMLGLSVGGIYTLSPLLPFVMIGEVGLSPAAFGLAMMMQSLSYLLGSLLTGRLLKRMGEASILRMGLCVVVVSALCFAIGLRVFPASLPTVMGPVALWAFGIAMLTPVLTTAALAPFGKIAGSASALAGCMQIGGGLVGSAVAAALFSDPLMAVATMLPALAVLNVATYLLLRKPRVRSVVIQRAPDVEDIEIAVDPLDLVGAGGEEIERRLMEARRSGGGR